MRKLIHLFIVIVTIISSMYYVGYNRNIKVQTEVIENCKTIWNIQNIGKRIIYTVNIKVIYYNSSDTITDVYSYEILKKGEHIRPGESISEFIKCNLKPYVTKIEYRVKYDGVFSRNKVFISYI